MVMARRSRLDAIWQHTVFATLQTFHTMHGDNVVTGISTATHGIDEIRKVNDFRFAGSVLDDRGAFGQLAAINRFSVPVTVT